MELAELQRLAARTRTIRETGIALTLAALVLGLFYFIPESSQENPAPQPVAQAAAVPDAFAHVPIEAKAAIVYDLATGKTLYAKNADAQLPLASLTKLLTVYAAVSVLPENAPITIPPEVTKLDAPRAFSPGQTFALSELARLTLTASLNDGAAAIADAASKQVGYSTGALLASAASALNLAQTYAVNGSGLDESTVLSGGYGSARDIAVLAGALVKKVPEIASATTEPTAHAEAQNGASFTVKNTDPIVTTVPGLLLSKTGYTDLAGGNLALVFDVGLGHPIAIIVLGSSKESRFTDGEALAAATLAHFAGRSSL